MNGYATPTVLHILLASQCPLIVVVVAFTKRCIDIIFLDSRSNFSINFILELLDVCRESKQSNKCCVSVQAMQEGSSPDMTAAV
jgi:hypothetical protein